MTRLQKLRAELAMVRICMRKLQERYQPKMSFCPNTAELNVLHRRERNIHININQERQRELP